MNRRNLLRGFVAFTAVAATIGLPKIVNAAPALSPKDQDLIDFIRAEMEQALDYYRFEWNDAFIRTSLANDFNSYLSYLKYESKQIIDYKVVCDESNNPPDLVARDEMALDVYIQPNKPIEYVKLSALLLRKHYEV